MTGRMRSNRGMTYNELAKRVSKLKPARSSAKNREKLLNVGIAPLGTYVFVGDDYKRYKVFVDYSRGYIGINSKHRKTTLEKHVGDKCGHLIDMA